MDVFKIVAVALLGVCAVVVLRQVKPEFTLAVIVGSSVVVLSMIVKHAFDAVYAMYNLSAQAQIGNEAISCIIKVVGIGYLAEFSDDICRDAGCSTIGNKVVFAAKVAIIICVFPIVQSLFDMLRRILL